MSNFTKPFQVLVLILCLSLLLFVQLAHSDENTSTRLPAQKTTSTNPATSLATDRGRVQISNNTVVADNGWPLRGEAMFLTDAAGTTTGIFTLAHLYDLTHWQALRDDFHLNTIRLFISRPPQNWGGGPGENCEPPHYRCYPLNYELNPPDTTLDIIDDMVDIASEMGMYIIIDYHPVGGYNRTDAINWWSQIAPRYKDRTHVIYELANEPVAWSPSQYDDDAIQFEEDLYTLIRTHAPQTHIILWTFAHAAGPMKEKVDLGTDVSYTNASVAFHPYQYNENDITNLKAAYPVMNNEIGTDRFTLTQNMEDLGISWIWLNGAKTHDRAPDGFEPKDVYWEADPSTIISPTVETPIIMPNGGAFTNSVIVTLSSATPESDIYYTLDNSSPNTSSILYTSPFTLAETTIVNATAFKEGYNPSAMASATFLNPDYWVYLPALLK